MYASLSSKYLLTIFQQEKKHTVKQLNLPLLTECILQPQKKSNSLESCLKLHRINIFTCMPCYDLCFYEISISSSCCSHKTKVRTFHSLVLSPQFNPCLCPHARMCFFCSWNIHRSAITLKPLKSEVNKIDYLIIV